MQENYDKNATKWVNCDNFKSYIINHLFIISLYKTLGLKIDIVP
jgi:hypothetical protein